MPSHLLVERALALVPEGEDFLALTDAVIGTSAPDRENLWAGSTAYATIGKRVVDPERLAEAIPAMVQDAQRRLEALFTLIVQAIRQQRSGDPGGAAETLIRAGEAEERERRLDKAEGFYSLALEIAKDLREKAPHVLALRRLARVARSGARLDEAWTRYEQSYQLSVDQMDVAGQVIACQGLGNVCVDRGQRDRARAWFERGLELARGVTDPSLTWPFHTNLSAMAMQDGNLAEAEALLATAREEVTEAGDPGAVLIWYNNRGLLLLEHGDPAGAEKVFREALERTTDPFWQVILRRNLGQSLIPQERLFEAEEEARRAEELAIVHRLIPYLVDVYELLGTIARHRRDEEGFVFFEQALRICRERGLPQVRAASVHHEYGLLYGSCGRPAEARAYLERARDIYLELGLTPELRRVREELEATAAPA